MESWSKKNKALPAAAQAFPGLVFREWLRMRRQGADKFFPAWRKMKDKQHRIRTLDLGAVLLSRFN